MTADYVFDYFLYQFSIQSFDKQIRWYDVFSRQIIPCSFIVPPHSLEELKSPNVERISPAIWKNDLYVEGFIFRVIRACLFPVLKLKPKIKICIIHFAGTFSTFRRVTSQSKFTALSRQSELKTERVKDDLPQLYIVKRPKLAGKTLLVNRSDLVTKHYRVFR